MSLQGGLGFPALRARGARLPGRPLRAPAVDRVHVGHDRPSEAHRARTRGHPPRAPEAPGPPPGPRPRRHLLLADVDGMGHVEPPRRRAPPRQHNRPLRRSSLASRPGSPLGPGRARRRVVLRRRRLLPPRLPQGEPPAPRPLRSGAAARRGLHGLSALRGRIRMGPPSGRRVRARGIRVRRNGRRLGLRGALPHPPRPLGRDPMPLSRRQGGGLRPRRQARHGERGRARHRAAHALDADLLLERRRGRALPRELLRALRRRLDARGLGALLRARLVCRLRAIGRHPEPRRHPAGHAGLLRSRRVPRRDREQPRRRHERARKAGNPRALRRARGREDSSMPRSRRGSST